MYHLLVSGCNDTWNDDSPSLPKDRCLRPDEYTPADLIDEYCQFTPEQNSLLVQLPALFAYESGVDQDARLGQIHSLRRDDRGNIRLIITLLDQYPPIPHDTIERFSNLFGIRTYELNRTHWALKKEDLGNALVRSGMPPIPYPNQPLVNIRQHVFDVALSFPGEARPYIAEVARQLVRMLGNNTVFYDNFYKSQLAVPNLDTALQDLYGNRAKLVVVFLSKDYAGKMWCGVEFRAIRKVINAKRDLMVMYVRFDKSDVEGVFPHDGYIDANTHTESELASMIRDRVLLLRMPS